MEKAITFTLVLLLALTTCAASTTKADVTGASVCDIMNKGQLPNISTFQKFYKKEIVDHSLLFQPSILSNVISREVVIAMTPNFKRKRYSIMSNSESVNGNTDMLDNESTHETLDNIIMEFVIPIHLHLWISQQRTA